MVSKCLCFFFPTIFSSSPFEKSYQLLACNEEASKRRNCFMKCLDLMKIESTRPLMGNSLSEISKRKMVRIKFYRNI